MSLKVIEFTTQEIMQYKERRYKEFLNYYFNTEFRISEILKIMGLPEKNSTVKYIRCKMKEDGYNSLSRSQSIRKGEWLK